MILGPGPQIFSLNKSQMGSVTLIHNKKTVIFSVLVCILMTKNVFIFNFKIETCSLNDFCKDFHM